MTLIRNEGITVIRRSYCIVGLSLTAGLMMLLGSCDLFFTAYTIHVRLGHQNPDDPNPVTFTISDLPPKSLVHTDWFPSGDSHYEYTVKLMKASDFTIVIETSDGTFYSQKITIEDGYRYSIYYQDAPDFNNIVCTGYL